jgi:hypothetical protein
MLSFFNTGAYSLYLSTLSFQVLLCFFLFKIKLQRPKLKQGAVPSIIEVANVAEDDNMTLNMDLSGLFYSVKYTQQRKRVWKNIYLINVFIIYCVST